MPLARAIFTHSLSTFRLATKTCLSLAALTTTLVATTNSIQAQQLKLGTNLAAVNDYSPQLPFVDIFKSSREWFTQCQVGSDPGCTSNNSWDTGESALLDLDTVGWVRSLPGRSAAPVFTSAATYWDLPTQFPGGTYIVLYAGEGTIE